MERIIKFRAVVLLLVFAGILASFSMRLFKLQIIETDGNTDNITTYTTMTRVKAARGDILDRNGNKLISNRASNDLVFNHFVIISSDNTNDSLYKLISKCNELGIGYNDHFPVTATRPFTYTLDNYTAAWRGYFQSFLGPKWCDLDSDITAPLLIQKLRSVYDIPEEWSDEEARAIIGLRYELDLRNVTNLASYIFIEDVSDKDLYDLLELNIPGLMVESSTVREYHTRYAAHILGSVGAMDEADWVKYKELGYAMDAYIGQSGFEEAFEQYLHAEDGTRIDVVSRDGTIISQYYANEYDEDGNIIGIQSPKAGNNVETTIDLELQIAAEDALDKCMKWLVDPTQNMTEKNGQDAQGAAAVVIDVNTGEVLACASYPTFDLATLNESYAEVEAADFAPLYNRALFGVYPPGSTFKPVTLIAAFNSGIANYETEIADKGIFTDYENFNPTCLVYSNYRVFHNGGEPFNAVYALEVSCNYFFYELGDDLHNGPGYRVLDNVAKDLGLGEHTGIELPESIGHRSNAESKAAQYSGTQSGFYVGDTILTAIGQSENRFTPMQLAVYASTLAREGIRMKATFLSRVVSSDYSSLVYQNQPVIANTMEISADAIRAYREGMYAVTYGDEGTGSRFFGGKKDNTLGGTMPDWNGYWNVNVKVAAKTGTAETFKSFSDNSAYICFAPYDNPQIAIALYGERVAHPTNLIYVAEEIMRVYFDVGEGTDISAYENQLG